MIIREVQLYFIPITLRVPLKFGAQVLEQVTCARTCITIEDSKGTKTEGFGETPLSVPWLWPSDLEYFEREEILKKFCILLAGTLRGADVAGHPMEFGCDFIECEPYLGFQNHTFNTVNVLVILGVICFF